jgi:hypothetical protein
MQRINLSPVHWGPKTWFFLESAAIAYPVSPSENQKLSAKNLIMSLQDLLPCEKCRINYSEFLTQYLKRNDMNSIVKDRDSLLSYIVDVHNDVRIRNGQDAISIEDVFSYYQLEYSKPVRSTETHNNKLQSKDDIIKILDRKEHFSNFSSDMLFHFNPITLLIGVLIGLIIYKFYSEQT